MAHSKLKQSLQHLQEEIDGSDSIPAMEKVELETIIENIRQMLDSDPDTAEHEDLQKTLSASIARFETSHPRLTGILNNIMLTLSNMGI